jgi:hypothetical protein
LFNTPDLWRAGEGVAVRAGLGRRGGGDDLAAFEEQAQQVDLATGIGHERVFGSVEDHD